MYLRPIGATSRTIRNMQAFSRFGVVDDLLVLPRKYPDDRRRPSGRFFTLNVIDISNGENGEHSFLAFVCV